MNKETKHPGGRPLIFKTVKEMQEKIDEYFSYCDNRIKTIYSEKTGDDIQISDPEPYTMSGLAYSLGIDRKTLINYCDRDEFFHTIKRARNRVEQDVERRMNDKATFTPGLIFNAKNNFDWRDKNETDLTSGGKPISPVLVRFLDKKDGDPDTN